MDNQYSVAIAMTNETGELTIEQLGRELYWQRGIICRLLMFCAVSVLTCTCLLAGVVFVFTYNGVSPPGVMVLCAVLNTMAAGFLYLCLKALTANRSGGPEGAPDAFAVKQ